MKSEIRVLGIDDSPFDFEDEKCTIIGTVLRADSYLEGVLRKEVSIKNLDATEVCIEMIRDTRHKSQLKAVLIDGCALGGFNIVDIFELSKKTGIPVITVTRGEPDLIKIKSALEKHFKDAQKRWEILSKGELHKIKTKHNPIFVRCAGIDIFQAKEIIKICTIRGVVPEPIRMAHIIASGISRGESYGKA